jgi:antirestriction protein ArdC
MSYTSKIKEEVTASILNHLESGVKPWEMPWDRGGLIPAIPANFHSGKAYRGINILNLWLSGLEHQFTTPYFMTFKQTKEHGGSVKEGAKGHKIYFFEMRERDVTIRNDKGQVVSDVEKYPMLKQYTVFNLDQIDGIEKPEIKTVRHSLEEAEALIAASGAQVDFSGGSAHYSRKTDKINMPACEFKSDEAFYATLLHELTHWTGHESRCNREFGKRFGDKAYAFEELVAEMGSAFLMAHLGMRPILEDHAGYLDHWISILKKDNSAIFTAATKASEACDYLMAMLVSDEDINAPMVA